jgi:hypothetical protein
MRARLRPDLPYGGLDAAATALGYPSVKTLQDALFDHRNSELAHPLLHLGHGPAHSYRHLHCERLRSQPRHLLRNHQFHQYEQRPRQYDPRSDADC